MRVEGIRDAIPVVGETGGTYQTGFMLEHPDADHVSVGYGDDTSITLRDDKGSILGGANHVRWWRVATGDEEVVTE